MSCSEMAELGFEFDLVILLFGVPMMEESDIRMERKRGQKLVTNI